ncbi:MAG: type II toxin-antitoxin system Phd/YefM family antitoxin, partial [Candidatus Methylomirabilales bacterium]
HGESCNDGLRKTNRLPPAGSSAPPGNDLTSQIIFCTFRLIMKEIYSTYEAKAKLSEILRQVRSGKTIRISNRGEPIAEIRPIDRGPGGWEGRVLKLTDQGVLVRSGGAKGKLIPVKRKAGALKRFLTERNE